MSFNDSSSGSEDQADEDLTHGSAWHQVEPLDSLRDLRDISRSACWQLSSCKQGYGVHELMCDLHENYWQSDGPQPHTVTIEFTRKSDVSFVLLYLDFKADESYTPNKISVQMGTSITDLYDPRIVAFEEPQGWQVIDLRKSMQPSRTWVLILQVLSNHQNGRDTHIRHLRVVGPPDFYQRTQGLRSDPDSFNHEQERSPHVFGQIQDLHVRELRERTAADFSERMNRQLTLR